MAVEADPKLILNRLFLSHTKGQEIPHFSGVKSTKRLQIESRAADLGGFPCCPQLSRPSRCPAAGAGGSRGPSLAAGTVTHPALPGDHGDEVSWFLSLWAQPRWVCTLQLWHSAPQLLSDQGSAPATLTLCAGAGISACKLLADTEGGLLIPGASSAFDNISA